jgi:hypothetical protein
MRSIEILARSSSASWRSRWDRLMLARRSNDSPYGSTRTCAILRGRHRPSPMLPTRLGHQWPTG